MGKFLNALARNRAHVEEMKRNPTAYLRKVAETDGKPNHNPQEIRDLPQGTVLFLPGSPGRAEEIADRVFDERRDTIPNKRGFDLHSGVVYHRIGSGRSVPVASMTSHMGFPSLEIAFTEIAVLAPNIKAIIRVGTSGAMSENVSAGDIVIAESASYSYLESLAAGLAPWQRVHAHPEVVSALQRAATYINGVQVHTGATYSKGRLYQDEFLVGRRAMQTYHAFVKAAKTATGHLNSEMETAELYCLAQELGNYLGREIKVGAFNLVIGEVRGREERGFVPDAFKNMPAVYQMAKQTAIELCKR